jgi:hypothetical protein
MKQTTMAPVTIGHRIFKRFPLLLAAICVAGCANAAMPADAAETGIRGTVLWGPVKPGPSKLGQADEAPLRASFTAVDAGNKAVEFESDRSGHFEVALPPGEYTIVPDKKTPIPMAEKQTTQVTVPEDGFAVVIIRLDTGMK